MRTRLVAFTAALLLFLSIASPAIAATSPIVGTGAYNYDPQTTQCASRSADGNTFLDCTIEGTFAGVIQGSFTPTASIILHADGSWEAVASDVCPNCTVDGRTGAYRDLIWGRGILGSGGGGSGVAFGSGGLAGLHGQLAWQEPIPFVLANYSARLFFDAR